METFSTTHEAKEFLIARIVEEAKRESVDLSEIERKMLYFSEVNETLPDMEEVSVAFDLEYDQAVYEEKMASIIHNFTSWAKQHDSATLTQWKSARKKLQSEEQYLLVLIGLADGSLTPLRSSSETSVFKLGLAIGVIGSVAIIALRVIWILIRR